MVAKTSASGWIKIIKIPEGEAPFEVRQAWVGLTLPCEPVFGYPKLESPERGVVTGQPNQSRRSVFLVPVVSALEILEQSDPEAAQWWRECAFLGGECFSFGEDEVEILSGVTRQEVVQLIVDGDAQGDLN
jgi:hypothetical protein